MGLKPPAYMYIVLPSPPSSPGLSEIMVMVDELQRLGFSHHVHEELLHSLHTRHEAQAMADALTVLQDMHRYVSVM